MALSFTLLLCALALALGVRPSAAAAEKPQLSVHLTALSPTVLKKGADITMRGTVTNQNTYVWDNVQAYLVIPRSPFTSRAQVDDAKTNSDSYTGERIVEVDSFDSIGDLSPGASREFIVKVPYEQLRITGADGVYPVGIQILATDPDGIRSNDAVSRATTFIPMLTDPPEQQIPTSIAWPFLMPTYRNADGSYAGARELLVDVGPGGRLRNLLGLARSTPADTGTVIIDPGLLVAVDELSRGKRVGKAVDITEAEKAAAESFVSELAALARRDRCWVVEFDRPDLLALTENSDLAAPLGDAIDKATGDALDEFSISCRAVSWPRADTAAKKVVEGARGPGDQPVIVTGSNLAGWDRRDGSLVKYGTGAGPVPLLVDDALDESVPGEDSVVTLRQRIVSESALAVLQRAIDPESNADAIAIVGADWNPGPSWEAGRLNDAFSAPWVNAAGLDSLLTRPIGEFDGTVRAAKNARSEPVNRAQLLAATQLRNTVSILSSILIDAAAIETAAAQDVAQAVSQRWRSNRSTGLKSAQGAAKRADRQLDKITIEGPPRVTLSSESGSFPLTISNGTDHEVNVGVRVDSSNPALIIPGVKPVTIAAGERHTLTVNVDVGDHGSASLTASLVTPDDRAFGVPAVFNVRSSTIGAVLWVGLALAGLLIVVAIARRFRGSRRSTVHDE